MGRASSEGVPVVVSVAHTNKVVVSRVEAANMFRPTTPMPPLRAVMNDESKSVTSDIATEVSGSIDEPAPRDTQPSIEPPPAVIDVPVLVPRDSQPALEVLAISPPPAPVVSDVVNDAAPTAIDAATTEPTRAPVATSLGVAPLEPATVVRAPFVIDTPVPRHSPLSSAFADHGRPEMVRTASAPIIPTDDVVPAVEPPAAFAANELAGAHHSRTAMPALDPGTGLPRPGPWQAVIGGLAKTIRSVRWWLSRRRNTEQIRRKP